MPDPPCRRGPFSGCMYDVRSHRGSSRNDGMERAGSTQRGRCATSRHRVKGPPRCPLLLASQASAARRCCSGSTEGAQRNEPLAGARVLPVPAAMANCSTHAQAPMPQDTVRYESISAGCEPEASRLISSALSMEWIHVSMICLNFGCLQALRGSGGALHRAAAHIKSLDDRVGI